MRNYDYIDRDDPEALVTEIESLDSQLANYCDECREFDKADRFRDAVAGYVADMQRHVKVAAEEGKFISPGLAAIVGHLHKLVETSDA
jgi:hypothetical protein